MPNRFSLVPRITFVTALGHISRKQRKANPGRQSHTNYFLLPLPLQRVRKGSGYRLPNQSLGNGEACMLTIKVLTSSTDQEGIYRASNTYLYLLNKCVAPHTHQATPTILVHPSTVQPYLYVVYISCRILC